MLESESITLTTRVLRLEALLKMCVSMLLVTKMLNAVNQFKINSLQGEIDLNIYF